MRTFKDYMNRIVEVIEIRHPKEERKKIIDAFIEEQDNVLAGNQESSYWLSGMKPFYTSANERRKRIAKEKEKAINKAKTTTFIPVTNDVVYEDAGFCRISRMREVRENKKNIPEERNKKQEKGLTYNMMLRGLVAENGLSILEDAEEYCRLLFGIPFEHGEGYTYKNSILSKMPNTLKFDYENGVMMLNKVNIPRKFVEYKKSFEGYYLPILPEKCFGCQFLEEKDVYTGKKDRYGNKLVAPRFSCNCNDIIEAKSYDCLPDIISDYSIPVENLCADTAEKGRKLKAAWVRKIMNIPTYNEASGVDEDLEIIAPGNKQAKKELMKKYSSIEICFLAFELKQLETKNEIKTESYSEIYTESIDECFDEWIEFCEDMSETTTGVSVEYEEATAHAEYDIQGSNGVNAFNYIQPHYISVTMKTRGLFDKCKTVQDLINTAMKAGWYMVDWNEYHEKKQDLINNAKKNMEKMIDWISKNPAKAKKRLTEISYHGKTPTIEINSDELNILWKHLKEIIPKKKTTTVYM